MADLKAYIYPCLHAPPFSVGTGQRVVVALELLNPEYLPNRSKCTNPSEPPPLFVEPTAVFLAIQESRDCSDGEGGWLKGVSAFFVSNS